MLRRKMKIACANFALPLQHHASFLLLICRSKIKMKQTDTSGSLLGEDVECTLRGASLPEDTPENDDGMGRLSCAKAAVQQPGYTQGWLRPSACVMEGIIYTWKASHCLILNAFHIDLCCGSPLESCVAAPLPPPPPRGTSPHIHFSCDHRAAKQRVFV